MNSDKNKKIISDLLSILNVKARYFWEAQGKLELVLKAELDTGSGPKILAPDAYIVHPIQEWCLENMVLKAELDTGDGPKILAPDAYVVHPIQEWCLENNCGRRMSYDTFRFRNQKQKTMFLLRWEGVSE
ncbi:MAG: hypothetical protein EBZ81_15930 [Betaproteobacteria bacterium]|nr:hypothetical protein [Betaproteobacteria bacterium]